MTLSDLQWQHLQNIAVLVLYAARRGWKLTQGRSKQYPGDVHYTPTSQHNKALANDLNLFKWRDMEVMSGWQYVSSTEEHRELGEFWESLSPHSRWGGRFEDGNHYETLEASRDTSPERWA